jgi:hypothetical protein
MALFLTEFPIARTPILTDSIYTINQAGTQEGRSTLTDVLGLVPDTLGGQSGSYYLNRVNHSGTQDSGTVDVTPVIKSSGSYTLLSADKGKVIEIDDTLTIPTGLGAGFYCSILLNNATAKAFTLTGLTIRGDAPTSHSAYGLVTVFAVAADTFWIKGETE